MKLVEIKAIIIKKRGAACEECGATETKLEAHHWLIHRMKDKPELDCEENIGLACKLCHDSGTVNNYNSRKRFWNRQKERGYNMQGWLNGLNLKVKENFE